MASGVNPLLALGLSTCVDIYADICDVLNGPAEQEQQCKENMKTELAALLGTPEDNHCSPTSLGCQHESIMDVVKVEEVSLQGPNFATWLPGGTHDPAHRNAQETNGTAWGLGISTCIEDQTDRRASNGFDCAIWSAFKKFCKERQ
ncbi:unnamed protein product [Cladocopium goreaui]|uniref:Uncharacterized protein n=1 Tax=Cladocopium goreaui TaxID=2562237 RepID=A0A9P1CRN6_9DINO|nr:unnamed protein product [Cladocopium goreaui]